MAKFRNTMMGNIGAKAMLSGHKWQKAFFVSLGFNIVLIVYLLVR